MEKSYTIVWYDDEIGIREYSFYGDIGNHHIMTLPEAKKRLINYYRETADIIENQTDEEFLNQRLKKEPLV